ncbi:MAG: GNAT family N-acetyltransferase [Anaerolineae bacterium]|nr:GNAT family N-acetyltransferase [Anaerolineae bacterium]MDW8070467.1 GNAT family N-acetyltransferase [Anaerolineae bacterium]
MSQNLSHPREAQSDTLASIAPDRDAGEGHFITKRGPFVSLTEIQPYTRAYARDAAEIHIEGQPGTFLTRLGKDFLIRLYELFAELPDVFGVVAVNGEMVTGVGFAAMDTRQLFHTIKSRYWHRLLWPVVRQVLRDPGLIGQLLQSIRYPSTLKPLPDEAEILFVGLRHSYMRQGIGPRILDQLLEEAYRRGAMRAVGTVEKKNRAVRWMIARLAGARVDQEIVLNGRKMLVYRVELPIGVDRQPPIET